MGFPGGSGQFSSVTQSCTTLCDPMDFSKPGFSVHHQLPELAQTHVHQVDDAIQPSYRRLSVKVAFSSQQGLIKALFFVVFQILMLIAHRIGFQEIK